MTLDEVKEEYIKMFGGYPEYLLMGADDDVVIKLLSDCIKSGKILTPPEDDVEY